MAGAGKSRFSKEARSNRERYGKRRTRFRPPLPIIVIVCDDAKTAVSYFSIVKRRVKESLTLQIERNPSDQATPADIIACATNHLSKLRKEASNGDDNHDAIWALIDLEENDARRQQALDAKGEGERAEVSVALSDPCYEMWTLLHLIDTGATFQNCRAVLVRVETEWHKKFSQEFGRKAQADYSKIMPAMAEAVKRARTHKERNDPSWTEVYLLIEEITRRSDNAQ